MYVHILYTYCLHGIFVYHACLVPTELGERVESPGTKVTNGCKSLCGCWVLFVVVVVSWDRVSL